MTARGRIIFGILIKRKVPSEAELPRGNSFLSDRREIEIVVVHRYILYLSTTYPVMVREGNSNIIEHFRRFIHKISADGDVHRCHCNTSKSDRVSIGLRELTWLYTRHFDK